MGLGSEIRGSGKKLFRIPDPGVKKAPDPAALEYFIPILLYTSTVEEAN